MAKADNVPSSPLTTPSSAAVQSARRKIAGGIRQSERRLTLFILVPALLFYFLFRYYPVLQTLALSLTNAQLLKPDFVFVGLENFQNLLADPLFVKTFWNTSYYALATTALTTILALGLAFIFEPLGRGSGLMRFIYFLPQVTSATAIATVWLWLYQPRFGLFNEVLSVFGLPAISWLVSTEWAMPSLIIMSVWGGVGFAMLILYAGIKGIPQEYAEAAIIDGASPLQVIWHVKLPLLNRVITFVLITGIIGSFQVFQQVLLMTNGGPLDATQVMSLQIYQTAFHSLRIGVAASMAFVLFIVVAVLTIAQLRLQRTDWEL